MPTILRATFKKGETLRFTGHLDILRTFVRGLRRADIPVKYSEGFNPHAVLTFALPLGVGTTSDCEIVDIAVTEELPVEDFISKVNTNMPKDGIKVLSAEYTEEKMPEIVKAEYVITYENATPIDTELLEKCFSSPIMVEKKSKRQMNEIDLSEHIFSHSIEQTGEKTFTLNIIVSAGNKFNIKPQLITEGLMSVCADFKPALALPHRKRFIFQ